MFRRELGIKVIARSQAREPSAAAVGSRRERRIRRQCTPKPPSPPFVTRLATIDNSERFFEWVDKQAHVILTVQLATTEHFQELAHGTRLLLTRLLRPRLLRRLGRLARRLPTALLLCAETTGQVGGTIGELRGGRALGRIQVCAIAASLRKVLARVLLLFTAAALQALARTAWLLLPRRAWFGQLGFQAAGWYGCLGGAVGVDFARG